MVKKMTEGVKMTPFSNIRVLIVSGLFSVSSELITRDQGIGGIIIIGM